MKIKPSDISSHPTYGAVTYPHARNRLPGDNSMKPRFTFFCILLALTACNNPISLAPAHPVRTLPPIPEGIDVESTGLFTDEPCGPPCLWGIEPGVTTMDQVFAIFSTYLPEEDCTLTPGEKIRNYDYIFCKAGIGVKLDGELGIVQSIATLPSQNITVSDVTEEFGEPSSVIVINFGVSDITTSIVLIYSELRMGIETERQQGSSFSLEPETGVYNIIYYSESELDEQSKWEEEWKGYQKY